MDLYAITVHGQPFVKIGRSNSVESRLKDLQTSSPFNMKIAKVWHGLGHMEPHVHDLFHPWRERGEWFTLAGPVAAFVGLDPVARSPLCPAEPVRRSRDERYREIVIRAAGEAEAIGAVIVSSSLLANRSGFTSHMLASAFRKVGVYPSQCRNGSVKYRGYFLSDILKAASELPR